MTTLLCELPTVRASGKAPQAFEGRKRPERTHTLQQRLDSGVRQFRKGPRAHRVTVLCSARGTSEKGNRVRRDWKGKAVGRAFRVACGTRPNKKS